MPTPSLTGSILGVLKTEINSGFRTNVQRLIPVKSGALKRSLRIRIMQRHGGVVLAVDLLNYFGHLDAVGVSGKLVPAIAKLMIQTLKDALISGVSVYFYQLAGAWDLPTQKAVGSSLNAALRFQFTVYLINDGRI